MASCRACGSDPRDVRTPDSRPAGDVKRRGHLVKVRPLAVATTGVWCHLCALPSGRSRLGFVTINGEAAWVQTFVQCDDCGARLDAGGAVVGTAGASYTADDAAEIIARLAEIAAARDPRP